MTVGTWEGEGVILADVIRALSLLRNQAPTKNATMTAVMSLVVVATSDTQADRATASIRAMGARHPARIILLRPDPDAVATLDATATIYAAKASGHDVTFEEISISVGGQAANHLDSLAEALCLADLPVTVWYPAGIPSPTDDLLSVANAIVLDSREAEGPNGLRELLEIVRRRTVVDLSWIRLRPWREMLAAMFDPPAFRAFLAGVDHISIVGKSGPRTLLGGWLSSQLKLRPGAVDLEDGRHVSISVSCSRGDKAATFEVTRLEQERMVRATASVSDGTGFGHTLELPQNSLAYSLSEGLTHLDADVIWERALSAATALAV